MFKQSLLFSKPLVLYEQGTNTKLGTYTIILVLSLFYAVCSQISIPLPFGFVPISIQPLPLYLAIVLFGWRAVHAYLLYLVQGAIGLPFFAHGLGGLMRLFGPTGGYLFGFFLAMSLLAYAQNKLTSAWSMLLTLIGANMLVYLCGLAQLSWFVPSHLLLQTGLYPFLFGDAFKLGIAYLFTACRRNN